MKVLLEDAAELEKVINKKLTAGYAWTVIRDDIAVLKPDHIKYFKTKKEAIQYRSAHSPDNMQVIFLRTMSAHIKGQFSEYGKSIGHNDLLPEAVQTHLDFLDTIGFEKARIREQAERLSEKIMEWGIPHNLTAVLEQAINKNNPAIVFEHSAKHLGEEFRSTLFLQAENDGDYIIHAFTSSLKKDVLIPEVTIGETNSRDLDRQMSKINWNGLSPFQFLLKEQDPEVDELTKTAISMASQLDRLSMTPEGKEVGEKIMAKHWLGTAFEGLIEKVDELDKKYMIRQNFDRIGETSFTLQEAYNIMSERYVSKTIVDNDETLQPWFYRHTQGGASFSNIIRVANSEKLDLPNTIAQLNGKGILLNGTLEENISRLRQGDEIEGKEISDGYKQDYKVYFNPFLNELETIKSGSRQKIDQSPDKDLRKGKSL